MSEQCKQWQEKLSETRQPTVETTATEHGWDRRRGAQPHPRRLKGAANTSQGHEARRDDLGVAHLVWRVFAMADGAQHVTPAIQGQDLLVHGEPRLAGGGGSPPLTLEEEPHGCQ